METTTTELTQKEIIEIVYKKLQDRDIHPTGRFDSARRFYLDQGDLINVRAPSRAWPMSQMLAGRTKKYVKKVCEKFNCKTVKELANKV